MTHTKYCIAHAISEVVTSLRDNTNDLYSDDGDNLMRWLEDGSIERTVRRRLDNDLPYGLPYDGHQIDCICVPLRGSFAPPEDGFATPLSAARYYRELNRAANGLMDKGWTQDSAYAHLEGYCDMALCTAPDCVHNYN